MKWIMVNEQYLDYLRSFERRIPYTDYGSDKYKPFFGVLFEKDGLCYITQISHPQERHESMRNQLDFFKIYDPDLTTRLIAVININYMFPVPKSEITPFRKSKINEYRTFDTEEEKSKYINLLDKELRVINTLNLVSSAKKLYDNKYNYPDSIVSQRCLDYKKLEEKAFKWIENKT